MNVGPQGPGPYNPPRSNNTAIIIAVIAAVGFVLLIVMAILAAILFPVFARARAKAQASTCMSNVQRISSSMTMYQTDWDSMYPRASNWQAPLNPYIKNSTVWNCPVDKSGMPSYALNSKIAGIRGADVLSPRDTIMIFESTPGANQAGGPELLPSEPRHVGAHSIGFADGHVDRVGQPSSGAFCWDPKKPAHGASEPDPRKAY